MNTNRKQVFYTPSRRRWRLFRGTILFSFVILLGVLTFVGWSISERVFPSMPALQDNETAFRKLTVVDTPQADEAGTGGAPRGFHRHLPVAKPTYRRPRIRAGFYVNWDAQSYQTLRDHVSELNMVMPEWLFVGNKGELHSNIDLAADSLLKAHPNVAVVPMISNFYANNWRVDQRGKQKKTSIL